jgi:two-component system, NtrC family, sensor kinase
MSNQPLILVVDDTPANLEVAGEILADAGYQVGMAIDGDRALNRVQTFPPDLILLDIQMPGIDGFEVCRRLKADAATASIPIIFMTALSDTDSKVRGLDLGAVDYITKPFEERELLARVKTHLQLSQLTRSLAQTVLEREQAIARLQSTQDQMVQQEKLSALGQMLAGVAHEINNPINFVHGNIAHLGKYMQLLLGLIQSYQQHYPEPPETLQAMIAAIDLDFLIADIPKLLNSSQMGADRILEIVLSLRNFSRRDEDAYRSVNLHEGIDNTLMILRHRLRLSDTGVRIQLIQNYGDLPLVECHPGQLNQVLMNLISNAIDALEDSDDGRFNQHPRTIWIETSQCDGSMVLITIADNAAGISETVRSRLFDPFFTTKPIGKGTGLGLSISEQIITERHHGQLWCESTLGEGTKFYLKIPIRQTAASGHGDRSM